MPVLTARDPLPHQPRAIIVAGGTGSGKTTVARRIAEVTGLRRVELDALFHGPGWVPRETFAAEVDEFSARPGWVTEWQYDQARELLAERADLVVWLDLPRRTVMRQVIVRTVARRLRRESLWNGNREAPLWTILRDREHIVRWAWTSHRDTSRRVTDLIAARPDLTVVRLRDRRETAAWLDGLARLSPRA